MGDSPSTKEEGRKRNEKTRRYESSPERRKQRAELNKKNREDGTYGNGDGKDKAHPSMKDQDESTNRREGQAKGARNRKKKKKTVLSRKKDD